MINRLERMAAKAKEIDAEFVKCCKQLGLPDRIESPIEPAPNYPNYYARCKEYTAIAKGNR